MRAAVTAGSLVALRSGHALRTGVALRTCRARVTLRSGITLRAGGARGASIALITGSALRACCTGSKSGKAS